VLGAVRSKDTAALLEALRDPPLNLGSVPVVAENVELYLANLQTYVLGFKENEILQRELILASLVSANQMARVKGSVVSAKKEVNTPLR